MRVEGWGKSALNSYEQDIYASCSNDQMSVRACVCANILKIECGRFISLLYDKGAARTPGCATSSGFAPRPPESKIPEIFPF